MAALITVLSLLTCSTLAQTLFTQSAGVKGTLMCGDRPLANAKVKLYDDDTGPDLDDLLAEGTTDSLGQFLLHGHTSEIMTIDPKLNIYHDCDDSLTDYVSSGEMPKKYFDIGHVNMQIQFKSEERDCLHRR